VGAVVVLQECVGACGGGGGVVVGGLGWGVGGGGFA